jgi:TBC1 domain family member 13
MNGVDHEEERLSTGERKSFEIFHHKATDITGLRSVIWRILLGCMPLEPAKWDKSLDE